MNEEEVKNSIIVPFFEELGFDESEIHYETSFTIKLGRSSYIIESTEEERKRGYLDILFKRNEENLFVVEVKHSDHIITKSDIEQAISYARLLQQIAPFSVVTNGVETRIFDVISTKEIDPSNLEETEYVKNDYEISLDPELKYHALKNFISLNFNNLKIFCKKQVERNINFLIGNNQDIDKKYIPDLYFRRVGLVDNFQKFLDSDKIVFSIIGDSGFGKTNAMCDLVQHYVNIYPIMFFNGSRIFHDLIDHIQYELDWEFGRKISGIEIIKRILDIFSTYNLNVIIFIDAIDESPFENIILDLDEFIRCIPENKIKICISCKKNLWYRFITIKGVSSSIYDNLYILNNDEKNSSYELTEFSYSELNEVINKYKKFFNLPEISENIKTMCKNPLMLRVISEVYASQNTIPDIAREPEIVSTYLSKLLEKSDDSPRDIATLAKIGWLLFERDLEFIYESDRDIDEIPNFLISFNLLQRVRDKKERYLIGFQYDYLRDYIICYHSLKLDKLEDDKLNQLVKIKIHEKIASQIIRYYEKFSEMNHKQIIRTFFSEFNKKRASEFIEIYQKILDDDFPTIKHRFYPHTFIDIGLLVFYPKNIFYGLMYGFREIQKDQEKVIWLEKDNWYSETTESERFQIASLYSVGALLFRSSDFTIIEPSEHAKNSISYQLKNIIEKRNLNEMNNLELLNEYILDIIRGYYKELGFKRQNGKYWYHILPISYNELIERTNKYIHQLNGQFSGIITGVIVPNDLLLFLNHLKIIRKHREKLDNLLLPFPKKIVIPRITAHFYNKYDEDEIIEYLNNFFTLVYNEYIKLVDYNFPNIKHEMEMYNKSPWWVIGEIEKKEEIDYGVTYTIIKSNDKFKIDFIYKETTSRFIAHTFKIVTDEGIINCTSLYKTGIRHFFDSDSRRDNIIQKYVYELIYDDLKHMFNW